MIELTALQADGGEAGIVWFVLVVFLYAAGGAAIGLVGFGVNRWKTGEEFNTKYIATTIGAGAVAGALAAAFGGNLDAVYGIAAILIPMMDKIINGVMSGYTEARSAHIDGDPMTDVILTFLMELDRTVDKDDIRDAATAIGIAAGPSNRPSRHEIEQKANELATKYHNSNYKDMVPEGVPQTKEGIKEAGDRWEPVMEKYPGLEDEVEAQVDDSEEDEDGEERGDESDGGLPPA